jgi:hypothetical protein
LAAAAAEVSGALVAQVPAQPLGPVPLVAQAPAPLPQEEELPALAPPVLVRLLVRLPALEYLQLVAVVLVRRVVEPAVPAELLLSRRWFSAAMEGSTP